MSVKYIDKEDLPKIEWLLEFAKKYERYYFTIEKLSDLRELCRIIKLTGGSYDDYTFTNFIKGSKPHLLNTLVFSIRVRNYSEKKVDLFCTTCYKNVLNFNIKETKNSLSVEDYKKKLLKTEEH